MVFGTPKKNVAKAIKKIETGHGNQKIVDSINKALKENPELIEDTAYQIIGIIQTDKTETFRYAIDILLTIAELEPDLLVNSAETLIKLIQMPEEKLDTESILEAMDILSILATGYPELMQPVVPPLLAKLHNTNSRIRSAAYYILDIIVNPHPEFFSDHTLDLIRSLHGLNIDERVYAVRLIGQIASTIPKVVDESYEVLNDLAQKHPDSTVRQEAYDVISKFPSKENENIVEKPEKELLEFEKDFIGLDEVGSEEADFAILADELAQRIAGIDFESSACELINSIGLGHLIKEKDETTDPKTPVETEPVDEDHISMKDIVSDSSIPMKDLVPEESIPEEDIIPRPPAEEAPKNKLPPEPVPDDKKPADHTLNRIQQLAIDPNIKPHLSSVRDLSSKIENEDIVPAQEIITETEPEEKINAPEGVQLSDIDREMLDSVIADISKEDWVIKVSLTTGSGELVSGSSAMDMGLVKKICDMLSLEESESSREGFRNRVSIELADKLLVAMSVNRIYNIILFTRPDIQVGLVLFALNKAADKIEQILS